MPTTHHDNSWKAVNTIYQIYPRSFKDSNGDGVGDIPGIIEKLDYLKGKRDSLGVDAIWLSPFFSSPMADFGYDVSNYRDVHPLFGTIDDFKDLLTAAHKRDIKVMIDFVPNHSSNEHPWFIESRKSKTNRYRDYYVWRDPAPDGGPPNNWLSIFGGSAWEFDEATGQYYLHTFLKEQPDLNWSNAKIRWEMTQILRFWFEMGVDGIRADAVRWIAKDPDMRDDPVNPDYTPDMDPFDSLHHANSRYGRDLFRYLRELTDVVESYPDRIMVFEDYPDGIYSTRDQYLGFYSVNPRVSMPFNFQGMSAEWGAESFGKFIREFQGMLRPEEHTPAYTFSNHDNTRLASRFGLDQARLIAILQMTLPGLPVMYNGDEIGMTDVEVPPELQQDPLNKLKPGFDNGRDPERTPLQWSADPMAGFTTADRAWLPIADDYPEVNVEVQKRDEDSFLRLYQTLLRLRNDHEVFTHGAYNQVPDDNADVLVFERVDTHERFYTVLNFSDTQTSVRLPQTGKIVCSSFASRRPHIEESGIITLDPYGAAVVRVE